MKKASENLTSNTQEVIVADDIDILAIVLFF